MLALYLSHPYGGKESNAMDADRIAMDLQSKFPQIAVFSPIHAVRNDYETTPYPIGLMYTLEQRLEHMESGKNRNNRNRHPINLLYVRKLIDHAKDLLWQEKQ